jgi:hypothetical protein
MEEGSSSPLSAAKPWRRAFDNCFDNPIWAVKKSSFHMYAGAKKGFACTPSNTRLPLRSHAKLEKKALFVHSRVAVSTSRSDGI